MLTDQLNQMNVIMRQAARRARKHLKQRTEEDLLDIWKRAVERLCVTVSHPDLKLRSDMTADQLRQLCIDKPWSYERFVDFVNRRL